ncbi:MAG: protein kinase [Chloroflexi bacterium]|nr:protein kinase [Chloroflexota bacterium]
MSIDSLDFSTLIDNRYRPLEWLGEGGMGRVLKAEDLKLDSRPVAIKFIAWQTQGDDLEKRERFRQEMRALARLEHPGIVHLYDFKELSDGTPYLVMSFMPGGSLTDRLAGGVLEAAARRRVLEELCDALDYIHDQNVVHRDLKPSNILFDASGHVRISDFGLAKLVDSTYAVSIAAGTPGFIAPEQRAEAFSAEAGQGKVPTVDHRADIYALGVTAWLLFTGQHPDDPKPLPPNLLSPELEQVLRKAFAHHRKDRYDSAGEFLEAIAPLIPRSRRVTLPVADERFGALVTQVPFAYRENMRRVLEDYTSVFGGRESEMEALDNWLSDPGQPGGIMQASAGRGKTALLVNWALDVQGSGGWRVVFHPISIRYQTADVNATVRCLAHALAPLFDSELPGSNQSPDVIRPQVTEWLRRGLPEGEQLLVIVDGLDETVGWPVETLFPRTPGPGVRLLVSARPLAGTDRLAWTTRLKWDVAATRFFDLGGLDRAALAEMLRMLPDEDLSALADDDTFVAELARVSEGDPLTTRMIVDALRIGDLTPQALSRRPPGLKAYLEDWLRELEERAESEAFWRLLGLCAAALGPLTAEDLAALAPDVFNTGRHIRSAVRAVERFILGDGTPESGYVFSHPRLREFFGDELLASERAAYQAAFIDYGQCVFEGLPDAPCPAYVRQFWMTHLAEAGEWDRLQASFLKRDEATGRYLWARMRYAAEGIYTGFLADLERLWQRADETSDIAVQIECALIQATTHSLSSNLAPWLLLGLVTIGTPEGKWSVPTALEHIPQMAHGWLERATWRQVKALQLIVENVTNPPYAMMLEAVRGIRDAGSRAEALVALIPHLPEVLLSQALAIACELPEEDKSAGTSPLPDALSTLAPRLPERLLQEALETAWTIQSEYYRAKVVAELASHLPGPEREHVLLDAVAVAQGIDDEVEQATTLTGMSRHLSEPLLRDVLAFVPTIQDERFWVNVLNELVHRLAESDLLEEALMVAREVKSPSRRAEMLAKLAPLLVGPELEQVLHEALAAVNLIDKDEMSVLGAEWNRDKILIELAPHLPEPLLQEALSTARAIEDNGRRADALAGISPYVSKSEQEQVLQEAVTAARTDFCAYALTDLVPRLAELGCPEEALTLVEEISESDGVHVLRPRVIVELVPHLPQSLMQKALSLARNIEVGWERGWALAAIAPHLAGSEKSEVLAEALAAVQVVNDQSSQLGALVALIPRLAELGCPDEALEFAQTIEARRWRTETLTELAPHVPEPDRSAVLEKALEAAQAIDDEWKQVEALGRLAPYLPELLLREALATARKIEGARHRAKALTSLVPCLLEAERGAVLKRALEATQAIESESERAETLSRLAPHLPEPLLWEALAAARRIGGAKHQAEALTSLVSCLLETERDAVLEEALEAARAIEDGAGRAMALARVTPQLPEANRDVVLEEALEAARVIEDGAGRAMALAEVIPHLPEAKRNAIVDEALEAAQEAKQEQEQMARKHPSMYVVSPIIALSGLAFYLTEPGLTVILQEIMALPDYAFGFSVADDLVHLAPYLSDGDLERALRKAAEAAYVQEDYIERGWLLGKIVPLLTTLSHDTLYPLWQEMLHTLVMQRRSDLLSDLSALSPVIAALGDTPTVGKIIHAIQNVGRAWP